MISFLGLICAVLAFLMMGLGMVAVIQVERHLGQAWQPEMIALGVVVAILTLFIGNDLLCAAAGILAGTILWGASELPDQAKRVHLGWYPDKPEKPTPLHLRIKKPGKPGNPSIS